MEKILKELESTFNIISVIPVSGNAVDAMADARAKLRYVYAELKKLDEDVKKDDC